MLVSFSQLTGTSGQMSTDHERVITSARKKRGRAKAFLKRLDGRVADVEARGELTIDDRLSSQQM